MLFYNLVFNETLWLNLQLNFNTLLNFIFHFILDRKERDKSEESDSTDSKFEDSQCAVLVNQINAQVSTEVLRKFIKTFLLETNSTNVRWQAHALLLSMYM